MLTQNSVVENINILREVADHIKFDYGSVYSPCKIANLFGISIKRANDILDQLTENKEIKRLDFEDLGPDLNLYFCDKPFF